MAATIITCRPTEYSIEDAMERRRHPLRVAELIDVLTMYDPDDVVVLEFPQYGSWTLYGSLDEADIRSSEEDDEDDEY